MHWAMGAQLGLMFRREAGLRLNESATYQEIWKSASNLTGGAWSINKPGALLSLVCTGIRRNAIAQKLGLRYAQQSSSVRNLACNIYVDQFVTPKGCGPKSMVAVDQWPSGAIVAKTWHADIHFKRFAPAMPCEESDATNVFRSRARRRNLGCHLLSSRQKACKFIWFRGLAWPRPFQSRVADLKNGLNRDLCAH